MQTNKIKSAFLVVGLTLLSWGCAATPPPTDIEEQNRRLSHIKGDYVLLYECREGFCQDYDEPCNQCSQQRGTASANKYKMTFSEDPVKTSNGNKTSISISIENSIEKITCKKDCTWRIEAFEDTYVMTVENVHVNEISNNNCVHHKHYHTHDDKGAGNHIHKLHLVFMHVDTSESQGETAESEKPTIVVYSLTHPEIKLDILTHRTTHGGGVDTD
ncbi:hypothetical protein D210916BOD24_01210 [Alteromonas sp. D210916BOD_24]|uniref:hypothetical protein n=1 Tax=Alteromonas sp. D210916BOD_24 TaxID=3157618 RepID=UPI00399C8C51